MITNFNKLTRSKSHKGLKDIWNAFMIKDAVLTENDIPFCPTTASALPTTIITWSTAKKIYSNAIKRKDYKFHYPAFVCFY